jgi:hypothetical protein
MRRILLKLGELDSDLRDLYDRIGTSAGFTGLDFTAGGTGGGVGTILARHGLIGGGTLPGTVELAQQGELYTSFFVMNDAHGSGGPVVIGEGSVLAESVTSL